MLSRKVRKQAARHRVSYRFLFMAANGSQLQQIARLFDAGVLRPAIARVFPFSETNTALAHVESGRTKGKVVDKLR